MRLKEVIANIRALIGKRILLDITERSVKRGKIWILMLGFKGLIIAVFSGARIRPRRFIERTEIYISYDPI